MAVGPMQRHSGKVMAGIKTGSIYKREEVNNDFFFCVVISV